MLCKTCLVYRWGLQEEPKLRIGHLKKKKNLMVFDESKIYGRHYVKIVIYLEKTLRIYYDH